MLRGDGCGGDGLVQSKEWDEGDGLLYKPGCAVTWSRARRAGQYAVDTPIVGHFTVGESLRVTG